MPCLWTPHTGNTQPRKGLIGNKHSLSITNISNCMHTGTFSTNMPRDTRHI